MFFLEVGKWKTWLRVLFSQSWIVYWVYCFSGTNFMSTVHFTFVMQPWLGRMHRRIRDATILSTQRGFCGLGIAASGSSCLETQDCNWHFSSSSMNMCREYGIYIYTYIRIYDISWWYIRKKECSETVRLSQTEGSGVVSSHLRPRLDWNGNRNGSNIPTLVLELW